MKEWFEKNKEFFKSKPFIIGAIVFIFMLIITITLGFGYIFVLLAFAGLYILSKQSSSERIISPKYKEEMYLRLRDMEEEADLIRQHVEENPQDLEAKLMLRELEKQIEELKNETNL